MHIKNREEVNKLLKQIDEVQEVIDRVKHSDSISFYENNSYRHHTLIGYKIDEGFKEEAMWAEQFKRQILEFHRKRKRSLLKKLNKL